MRLRRSDFRFPSGRQRRDWRAMQWALRRLSTGHSYHARGSAFYEWEAEDARNIVYWCARHAANPRGTAALQGRAAEGVWTEVTEYLAVWG